MDEFIRPRPLCLVLINGFHVDYLEDDSFKLLNFKKLTENYPFLILKSSKDNVSHPYNSYVEIGAVDSYDSKNSLSKIISSAGLFQLHITGSDTYSEITYFLNGKNKTIHDKEDWVKIDSSEFDYSHDSSEILFDKITKKTIREINKQIYDFIVIGYDISINQKDKDRFRSNAESLGRKMKILIDIVLSFNGALLITSNSSLNQYNNLVPLFLISKFWKDKSYIKHDYSKKLNEQKPNGAIKDIGPTILKIMGISKPKNMSGKSLI